MANKGNRDTSPKRDSMSAGWCWTLNNYKEKHVKAIKSMSKLKTNKVKYIVFGKEKGKQGTAHLQGYIHFEGRKRFSTVKKLFKDHAGKDVQKLS